MKKSIIYIVLIFLSFGILKAQETDAVFNKIKKEYFMHPDGSLEFKYFKQLKYNTEYAFNRLYGETFVIYNPDFQKLVINKCYTVKANGEKVMAPENAFNEVLPRNAADYPAYNQMREMVITHTGLEVGATVYLEYSILSNPTFTKEMMGEEILAENVPVEDYEIVFKVPARRGLQYDLLNSTIKPTEENDGQMRSYSWTFKNVSHRAYEQAAPPAYFTNPTLIFSTFSDENTALESLYQNAAFSNIEIAGINTLIEKTKTEYKDLDIAYELQKYVVNNINTKHIPLDWHNYQLQTPSQVWNANVGNELEKTILLSQILTTAGFNTEIIGFRANHLFNPQIGILEFDDLGVLINCKSGQQLILSATSINKQSLELENSSHVAFNLKTGKVYSFQSTQIIPAINLQSKLTLDPDNQDKGEITVKLSGSLFDNISLVQDTQGIKRYFVNAPPFSKEQKVEAIFSDFENAKFTLVVDGKNQMKKQENYYFWSIPQMNNGIASNHFVGLPSLREFPLLVPAFEENYEYSITLPKSVEWVGQEIHMSYDEAFGKMSIDIAMKDGQLMVKKQLKINPEVMTVKTPKTPMPVQPKMSYANERMLTLEEYAIFRQMMIDWNSERVNDLVFKR